MPPINSRRTLAWLGLSAALMMGCATAPSDPRLQALKAQSEKLQALRYVTVQASASVTGDERWSWSAEEQVDARWNLPAGHHAAPLILYIPGLGQDRDAGQAWAQAWAEAGYAVLTLPLRQEDVTAWQGDAAREGRFDDVYRQALGEGAMQARQARLQLALARLLQRQKAQLASDPASRIDLTRWGLAGNDLGGLAAIQLLGGRVDLPSRPAAALWIDPAWPEMSCLTAPRLPMLDIRRFQGQASPAPWTDGSACHARWPAAGLTLLGMDLDALHGRLSALQEPAGPDAHHTARPSGSSGRGRRGDGAGMPSGRSGGKGDGLEAQSSHPATAETAALGQAPRRPPGFQRQDQALVIRSETQAFWDMHLRQSTTARTWWQGSASRWPTGLVRIDP